jgi:hypothetical protein
VIKIKRNLAIAAAAAALIAAAGGTALAATSGGGMVSPGVSATGTWGCFSKTGQLEWLEMSQAPHTCASGLTLVHVSPANGTQGPAGPAGKNAIVSVNTADLGGIASVATGGSFVTGSTEVGTGITLKAGTYLISLNAKATPDMTSAVQVFPQFFVYDQAKNASFTGDLLNVGAGALESGGHVTIDSYYSGTAVITLAADTTLHVYAFGYDSDTGAGTYVLDDLTVTATQLNT